MFCLKIKAESLQIENEYQYIKDNWKKFYNNEKDMLTELNKTWDKSFICKHNIDFNLIEKVTKL